MPTYLYECEGCGNQKTQKHGIKKNPKVQCDDCTNPMFRVITGGTGFIIKESNGPISSKPDSYFANAEWNRKRARKQRMKDKLEKHHYKDKGTVNEVENIIDNAKNMGNIEREAGASRVLDKMTGSK